MVRAQTLPTKKMEVVKKYSITLLLFLTIILNQVWTFWKRDCVNEICERFYHLNGDRGFTLQWHYHKLFGLINSVIFTICIFIAANKREGVNSIEKDSIIVYGVWSFYGIVSYLYFGWPESTKSIVTGFGLNILLFLFLRICKYDFR